MDRLRAFRERTFASLAIRNYRLFFIGQGISLSGTWMQTVAQGLLVLQLTGSGTTLGIVTALQTLPILLLGAWGGLVADRFPKRTILYTTQSLFCLTSLATGALIIGGTITIPIVYAAAILTGIITAIDNPTRQTFVREMVDEDGLTNAVSLNSTEINLARVVGPLIAGIIVATLGIGVCFVVNGLSYIAVVVMLTRMLSEDLHPAERVEQVKGQLVEGLRYAWSTPVIRSTLLMMALIGTFTYEFTVILPLFSDTTFGAGSSGYAFMSAALGIGAVIGGLYTASRKRSTSRVLIISACLFGLSMLLTAVMPSLILALAALLIVGFFSINFTSLSNVRLQTESDPKMQGRVMSLWSIAFIGTTPIGGPIIGAVGEFISPRAGILVGGIAAIAAAVVGVQALRHGGDASVREILEPSEQSAE